MTRALWDVEDSARSSLEEWLKDNPDHDESDLGEAITEIADSSVPVYTADLLECALNNLWLAVSEPELEGHDRTAVACISANLYEHLEEKLWKWAEEIQDELAEENEEESNDSLPDGWSLFVVFTGSFYTPVMVKNGVYIQGEVI